jgi:hypothetical protein
MLGFGSKKNDETNDTQKIVYHFLITFVVDRSYGHQMGTSFLQIGHRVLSA